MKTMNDLQKSGTTNCQKFSQLSVFIFLSLLCSSSFAFTLNAAKRAPASAFEEEVLTVPLEQKVMIQTVFAEDDAGVMKGTRDQLKSWDETEEYVKRWDLESTSLYKTPGIQDKSKFITKSFIRYVDKRIAGEVKNADEGSTFHAVGKMEKSLRPNASVPVSKYLSLKFKVRVLQGKGIVELKNPWIDCNATVGANGTMKVLTKKDFNLTGTSTGAEYNVNDTQWLIFVDQEINKNIKARLSSTQQPNGNDADKRLEMNASFPFNL